MAVCLSKLVWQSTLEPYKRQAVADHWPGQGHPSNSLPLIHTLLCGTRSLTAMESRAIAGGLSADHQLPGVPKAKEVS
jgi:hypothetical protein